MKGVLKKWHVHTFRACWVRDAVLSYVKKDSTEAWRRHIRHHGRREREEGSAQHCRLLGVGEMSVATSRGLRGRIHSLGVVGAV